MTWYVLRHAEKEQGIFHNPQLRHQDQPLSARGRQDAQKLVALFAGKPIAAIYVSAYQLNLCGLTELSYQEKYRRWKLLRFNQTYG